MAHFSNAELAQSIADMIAIDLSMKEEFVDWLAGTVGGGPNTDGKYPLTDYLGESTLVTCPAQMEEDVNSEVTGAAGHATDAETAQTAAETAETNAETAQTAAETAETASVSAKDASVSARADAISARQVAIAQAAAAAADAVSTAADAVSTAADEVSTDADATASAISAAKAEDWAVEVEDTPVETGPDQFSALHWAAKAEGFGGGPSQLAARILGGM